MKRQVASRAAHAAAEGPAGAERLQKVIAQLGLGSRREAEAWIRAGRLSVNGRAAVLGMRVSSQDKLRLDGRLIRQRANLRAAAAVLLCHRSPGQPLLPPRTGARAPGAAAGVSAGSEPPAQPTSGEPGPVRAARAGSFAEHLPRSAGRRFISVSPLAAVDGGLELLTADGTLAARLQRAVGSLPMEFSLRVRGELSEEQRQSIEAGQLDSGMRVRVQALEAAGGEASNRWYRLVTVGASGAQVRQLIERQAVTLTRALRTRLGALALPPTLARGRWRELSAEELSALLDSPAPAP
ncbi:MAG TPA: S4 domain-containing protein [Steroidobacteraceae bacterium]|nr:S4 domain-containing protein [Steroidobacteraceae bacterium]